MLDVALVGVPPVALLSGGLDQHAGRSERADGASGGGLGRLQQPHHRGDAHQGMAREQFKEANSGGGRGVVLKHPRAIRGDQGEQIPRGGNGLVGDARNAAQEEIRPPLPVPIGAHGAQAAVILVAMSLEEEAQIQERLREELPVLQKQRDQQPADAAVAVEVRVDGLELNV